MQKGFFILSLAALFFCDMPCEAQRGNAGVYYEITTTTHTTQMDVNNSTKVYVSPSGSMRQETQATLPLLGKIDMVTLTAQKDPSHVTTINTKTKVYAVTTVPPNADTVKEDMGKVNVINSGKATLNGFPCTALKIIDKGDTTKIWVSNSVPVNQSSPNILAKVMGVNPNGSMATFIREKGYKGSWVKFAAGNANNGPDAMSVVMELTKAKYTDVPESLMKIPVGYTETKGDPFAVHVHNETKINEHFKANGKIGE